MNKFSLMTFILKNAEKIKFDMVDLINLIH